MMRVCMYVCTYACAVQSVRPCFCSSIVCARSSVRPLSAEGHTAAAMSALPALHESLRFFPVFPALFPCNSVECSRFCMSSRCFESALDRMMAKASRVTLAILSRKIFFLIPAGKRCKMFFELLRALPCEPVPSVMPFLWQYCLKGFPKRRALRLELLVRSHSRFRLFIWFSNLV